MNSIPKSVVTFTKKTLEFFHRYLMYFQFVWILEVLIKFVVAEFKFGGVRAIRSVEIDYYYRNLNLTTIEDYLLIGSVVTSIIWILSLILGLLLYGNNFRLSRNSLLLFYFYIFNIFYIMRSWYGGTH